MNTAGWLLTESGRQPWIVQGIMLTKNAVSPSVGLASVISSLTVFVAAYLTLAIVDVALMIRYGRKELEPEPAPADGADALVKAVRY
jgi:cytochrome d ubiquinol oxidase subunit I